MADWPVAGFWECTVELPELGVDRHVVGAAGGEADVDQYNDEQNRRCDGREHLGVQILVLLPAVEVNS